MSFPIHKKLIFPSSFDRLDRLWNRYPQFHEPLTFTTLEELLKEHEAYGKDFDEALRVEYEEKGYGRFLVQLSWSDLPYRYSHIRRI